MDRELQNEFILNPGYTWFQLTALVVLRIIIGWHFLYEGLAKLFNPNWTSSPYLLDSKGFLSELFWSVGSNPGTVNFVDFLNTWGLIIVGFALIIGLFNRIATGTGILYLALIYLSHIPFYTLSYNFPSEGSNLLVNRTLIELVALIVLFVFPTGKLIGIDRLRLIMTMTSQLNKRKASRK